MELTRHDQRLLAAAALIATEFLALTKELEPSLDKLKLTKPRKLQPLSVAILLLGTLEPDTDLDNDSAKPNQDTFSNNVTRVMELGKAMLKLDMADTAEKLGMKPEELDKQMDDLAEQVRRQEEEGDEWKKSGK